MLRTGVPVTTLMDQPAGVIEHLADLAADDTD